MTRLVFCAFQSSWWSESPIIHWQDLRPRCRLRLIFLLWPKKTSGSEARAKGFATRLLDRLGSTSSLTVNFTFDSLQREGLVKDIFSALRRGQELEDFQLDIRDERQILQGSMARTRRDYGRLGRQDESSESDVMGAFARVVEIGY